MNVLKEKVISYLNMGLNPTVIGFPDDGLYYLFDILLQGVQKSNGYDPTYSFVHIALNSLSVLDPLYIEDGINKGLIRDSFPGDNVYETLDNEVETVCIIDDLYLLDKPEQAINIADALHKKYRGKLKFVFLIEDPLFLTKIKDKVSASSILHEAIIYQHIGKDWVIETLKEIISKQYRQEVSEKIIEEFCEVTNEHFGLTRRKVQDSIAETDSFLKYSSLLLEGFGKETLNAFKKYINNQAISDEEKPIIEAFENVKFLIDGKINIPILHQIMEGMTILKSIDLNEESRLSGIDLNLLNNKERLIIETLMKSDAIVKKEDIGRLLWDNEFNSKYSEWAIDQRIARLRKKIIDFGFDVDIETVYGKGYKLNKITKK